MKKKFKAKKKKRYILKLILIILFIYVGINVLKYSNIKLANSNEEFIKYLLEDSNHYLKYKGDQNIFEKLSSFIINIKSPKSLIKNIFETKKTASDSTSLDNMTFYMNDPKPVKIDNPRVYIYNTHQLENYELKNYQNNNITPNVLMASYLLKDKLIDSGVKTVVLEDDVTAYLKQNKLNYNQSYKASRNFLVRDMQKYSNLDLIIDLHRDGISKKNSTVTINNKECAKVLFVAGLEHKNYQQNLDLMNKINAEITKLYPKLTRGVSLKKGNDVNGIYNQDVSSKIILLELGGNENEIDEVENTLDLLVPIIKKVIGG